MYDLSQRSPSHKRPGEGCSAPSRRGSTLARKYALVMMLPAGP